jgi:hypothetical protein
MIMCLGIVPPTPSNVANKAFGGTKISKQRYVRLSVLLLIGLRAENQNM